ncbi:MAG: hypothetical protein E7580_06335 [Ruminococcaceae bacterium]|nr:hypothetical protein [Oscillospiraceae bacterium]
MKIQYLGTAAAERIPAIFCNCPTCQKALKLGGKNVMTHSQVLLDDTLLVDLSCDTWHHFLALGKTVEAIGHVLITHSHYDHFSLDELLFRSTGMAKDPSAKTLNVYASADVIQKIKERLAASSAKKQLQMVGRLTLHTLEYYVPSEICGFTVTPFPATHAGDENAMIFLIEKDGKAMFYGNDTGVFTTEIDDYLATNGKHVDLLSLDCTKGNQPFLYNHHMCMAEGRKIADRFFKKGILDQSSLLYYTHFSHNCGNVHDELAEIAKQYGFSITHDGFIIEL